MSMSTRGALSFALMILVLCCAPPSASAATIRVDSFKDKPDVTLDGNCEAANGDCTLRAALREASFGFFPGLDTIKLKAGTYKLKDVESSVVDTPDLDVQEQVSVVGRGMNRTTVEQTADAGVFEVYTVPGITTFTKLTIRGGRAPGGAGIASRQMLVLDRVKLTDNVAESSTSTIAGGALHSSNALSVTRSKIVGNRAHTSAMGASASGGGIYHGAIETADTLEIHRTVIARNEATTSGAADNSGAGGVLSTGIASIEESTIADNEADHAGGGVFHTASDAGSHTLTITRSTLSGNTAQHGGGLIAYHPVVIENSTVSDNTVSGPIANGGAIYRAGGTTIGLDHVTVTGNVAPPGKVDGLFSDPSAGAITLNSSLIANPGTDCGGTGMITSLGYNVSSGSTCPLTGTGDLNSANTMVLPLADNGGPTETVAFRGASDAKNAVTAGCPPPITDQRGVTRPQGSACDAGAYEKD